LHGIELGASLEAGAEFVLRNCTRAVIYESSIASLIIHGLAKHMQRYGGMDLAWMLSTPPIFPC
jgi:hypothetical protein